jgi:hypothetical protein
MCPSVQFKEEPQKRDKALTTLLPLIRFPFLRARFLVQKVETDKSVMHLPIVHSLLYEAYRFRMYPAAHTTFRTEARRGMAPNLLLPCAPLFCRALRPHLLTCSFFLSFFLLVCCVIKHTIPSAVPKAFNGSIGTIVRQRCS